MSTFKTPPKGGMTDAMARTAAALTATQADSHGGDDDPFQEGDSIVYAAHGVGRVDRIGIDEIAGTKLEIIQISFPGNQMTLRIPLSKARKSGLRKIVTRDIVDKAMSIIKGKPHVSKGMWARRAVAYQEKINSGDLIQIARFFGICAATSTARWQLQRAQALRSRSGTFRQRGRRARGQGPDCRTAGSDRDHEGSLIRQASFFRRRRFTSRIDLSGLQTLTDDLNKESAA